MGHIYIPEGVNVIGYLQEAADDLDLQARHLDLALQKIFREQAHGLRSQAHHFATVACI